MFGKRKERRYTDLEIIRGIQEKNELIERAFYNECNEYFQQQHQHISADTHPGAHEYDDLFQDSFLSLWTEIMSRKIHIRDNYPCRIDRHGNERKMSVNLKTFLLAIAKNKHQEISREDGKYVDELDNYGDPIDEEPEGLTMEQIVAQCVNGLSQSCQEILTLYYYKGKSLDEIMSIRSQNQSTDGVKTAKYKCMVKLKGAILTECKRRNIKPYAYA